MKRPAFQFYPGDWLRATELRSCSVGARGLWIDMICLMHEGSPYGYLKVGEKVILPSNLARMVGATLAEVEGWLGELEDAQVFSRDDAGCIFSRRMVRDENLRKIRAEGGKLGGNPALKKVGSKVNLQPNLKPTPASASASALEDLNEDADASSSVAAGDPPKKPPLPDCPQQAIVELWHTCLPELPRVVRWTDQRAGMLRSRWREWAKEGKYSTEEEGLAFWQRFFAYVGECPFLVGKSEPRDGKPPFVADLEWVIRPQNLAKIIEGRYRREVA